ncbi:MAG TPA: hypothetical protein VGZ25_05045, partial [Gemmataceae bacterium]|nr:hypothetical protein [Gemmataceae bacterium]
MGLLLIWIESIAAGLLLVAWILSWTARFRWRITQAAPPVVVAFLLAMPTGTLAGLSAVLVSRGAIQPGTFWYFTTWSVSFGAGLLIVLYGGL